MAAPVARSRGRRVVAEINVTPFVDVMLVLLIIFMVTAPMMQQGIDVDLPETTTQPIRVEISWMIFQSSLGIFVETEIGGYLVSHLD